MPKRMPIEQWSGEDLYGFKGKLFEAIDEVFTRKENERLRGRHVAGQFPFGLGGDDEREIVKRILLMKAQGTSCRKIACILNHHGVPTKRKGTKWHGWTVNKMVSWICCRQPDIANALEPLPPPPKREFVEVRKLFKEMQATEIKRDEVAWGNAMSLAFSAKHQKSYDGLSDADVKRIMRSFFLEARETLRYMVSTKP